MPGIYQPGDYDLAGFAVGAAERDAILPRDVAAGDIVLGLASSGVHSNGFSLVRKVADRAGLTWSAPAPFDSGKTLGEAVLTPTRLYVKSCLAAIRETKAVKALAHITGGGFPDNIPRVLPDGVGARIDICQSAGAAGLQMARVRGRRRRKRDAAHLQLRDRHDRRRRAARTRTRSQPFCAVKAKRW